MRAKLNILLVVVALLPFVLFAKGDDRDRQTVIFDVFRNMPSSLLIERANDYFHRDIKDSAMVCYSIVAGRRHTEMGDTAGRNRCVTAMLRISQLNHSYYNNYPMAIEWQRLARETAEHYKMENLYPLVYFNDALISTQAEIMDETGFDKKSVDLFKKAFHASLKNRDWNCLMACMLNMLIKTTFLNKEEYIRPEMDIIMHYEIPDTVTHLRYVRQIIQAVDEATAGRIGESIAGFNRLSMLADSLRSPSQIAYGKVMAAKYLYAVYYSEADYRQAERQLLGALEWTNDSLSSKHRLDIYFFLAELYGKMGLTEKQNHYRLLFLEGKNDMLRQSKLMEVSQSEFQLTLKKKDEEMSNMARRHAERQRLLGVVLVFSVIVAVIMLALALNYRKLNRKNRVLYENILREIEATRIKQESAPAAAEEPTAPPSTEKYAASTMTDSEKSDLRHRIIMMMETSPEVYAPDFTLDRLSELVDGKRYQVSQVINEHYGKGFSMLLAEYRVKEACRRMSNGENRHLTIEAIAESVGFKSRSNFISNFKRVTGMTPSTFQRMAK